MIVTEKANPKLFKFIAERTDAMERIWTHYDHAKEKHPKFCDGLLPCDLQPDNPNYMSEESVRWTANQETRVIRGNNTLDVENHGTLWNNLLNEEVWEATDAMARGDKPAAVEECYDAIAVLLRTIDVLEGRQPLGEPRARKDGVK